jgi:predicted transposase YbfD/YdcC
MNEYTNDFNKLLQMNLVGFRESFSNYILNIKKEEKYLTPLLSLAVDEISSCVFRVLFPIIFKGDEVYKTKTVIEINAIQNFLNSLDKDKEYILLIAIICNQGMYMAPKSKIENVRFDSSAETLYIKVNFEISTIIERYNIDYISHIVFRYREFLNKPIEVIPSKFPVSVLPVSRKQKNNLFTNFLAPFSLNSNKFGKLIEDNGDIKTYLYNDKFLIEREFCPVKDTEFYKLKVYNKNKNELLAEFLDERISNNEFIRNIESFKLRIKAGVLSMFESTAK